MKRTPRSGDCTPSTSPRQGAGCERPRPAGTFRNGTSPGAALKTRLPHLRPAPPGAGAERHSPAQPPERPGPALPAHSLFILRAGVGDNPWPTLRGKDKGRKAGTCPPLPEAGSCAGTSAVAPCPRALGYSRHIVSSSPWQPSALTAPEVEPRVRRSLPTYACAMRPASSAWLLSDRRRRRFKFKPSRAGVSRLSLSNSKPETRKRSCNFYWLENSDFK
uniref:uncharacterized protein LOC120886341 n=1 Tax=Ictidomys tridecemlineatus TaxID=43179 RepID=UPI001A9CD3AF|nr:uncharacterized protein LOC120886341 [Ictidomys tridecemlineatus]XP_040131003.1 uncharacterized protein LOC120886341 [Ictidomys tridecemlineatus]